MFLLEGLIAAILIIAFLLLLVKKEEAPLNATALEGTAINPDTILNKGEFEELASRVRPLCF